MGKYKFGNRSRQALATCDPRLETLAKEVLSLELFDFGITCGYRSQDTQEQLYFEGKTKVHWPDSKHNSKPSSALDFVLYTNGKATYREEDKPGYYMAVGVFRAIAAKQGLKIRCGADWDGDFSVEDQSFHDLPHLEISE
jgi:peptidoglycan L-alanyl-D-glutamate endopeptidase CwlK